MANENAIRKDEEFLNDNIEDIFDLDEFEAKLQDELEAELSQLKFLEEEKSKIGNPDALGKVILDEIWNQFSNQIGLDITNETLNQKYDRVHAGETYSDVGKKVMQDSRYKEANKAMKEKQKAGNLKDEYTGKNLGANDKANLDHVVSRKEVYENKRRQQAGIPTEDLVNKSENLKATNESLNKSKGAKSVDEYVEKRPEREKSLKEQNERAKEKIDKSNMSDAEKAKAKEKSDKSMQDKLDADDKLMKNADKEARKSIDKSIAKGVAKETGKKAAKDALKQMSVAALSALLKEVVNALVRFLKSQAKSFKGFLDEMKKAIKAFFEKIRGILHGGASSAIGTVVNEIFGPIVSTFKKLASLIKQGISSVYEAIRYLADKKNKDKPFSEKVAQVGKIITAGIVAGGAIVLGEVFEKALLSVPGMLIELPMLGTLANVIGMFLASMVSGLIGAIIINRIDVFIAKRQKAELDKASIDKGNEILAKQYEIIHVNEVILERDKIKVNDNISERHQEAAAIMKNAYSDIMEDFMDNMDETTTVYTADQNSIAADKKIEGLNNELDDLLAGLSKGSV